MTVSKANLLKVKKIFQSVLFSGYRENVYILWKSI